MSKNETISLRFQYRALQAGGQLAEGFLDARGRQEALSQLESRGLKPIRITEVSSRKQESGISLSGMFSLHRISFKDLENFTRLLASLLASGIPLSRALVILVKETANPAASARWKEIHDSVVDGASLADSMARFPSTFPRVYVAMVQAGETGGFLDRCPESDR